MKKAESDLRTINMEKGTLISFMPKGRQIQHVWKSVSIFFFFDMWPGYGTIPIMN